MQYKPYECTVCGARCKTIQGLRGHERFRHGKNASPARRFRLEDGKVFPAKGGEGLTFTEVLEELRWDRLLERLDRIEKRLKQLSNR